MDRDDVDKIVIEDVPPYDGEYEFEGAFTNRELHIIKRISGVRAGELEEASTAMDSDLLVAIAVVLLRRAGKLPRHVPDEAVELFWEAEAGSIRYVGAKGDAGPPAPTSSDALAEPSVNDGSSGAASSASSGTSEESDPSRTGLPDSGIGAGSDLETSAS